MTDAEKNKLIANVKASFAMENIVASFDAERISRQFLDGDLTSEQAIQQIKALYAIYTPCNKAEDL